MPNGVTAPLGEEFGLTPQPVRSPARSVLLRELPRQTFPAALRLLLGNRGHLAELQVLRVDALAPDVTVVGLDSVLDEVVAGIETNSDDDAVGLLLGLRADELAEAADVGFGLLEIGLGLLCRYLLFSRRGSLGSFWVLVLRAFSASPRRLRRSP